MLDHSGREPDLSGPESPHFLVPESPEKLPADDQISGSNQALTSEVLPDSSAKAELDAWEEVTEGRFMPKRVRGSCHGRALG